MFLALKCETILRLDYDVHIAHSPESDVAYRPASLFTLLPKSS